MKKTVCILLALLLCAVSLSSCGKRPETQILGKWSGEANILGVVTEYSYEFREDGSGVMSTALNLGLEMHYTLDDTTLEISTSVLGIGSSHSYHYVFEGETLTLTEIETGNVIVLTKTA